LLARFFQTSGLPASGLPRYTSRVKLTVTVITRNEAANLAGALESVKWADEIVVVDSRSSDQTVEIARRYASRVEIHDWKGYSAQRNYAAEIAANDWILAIDADERVPPELAAEIQQIMRVGPTARGYRMPRVSFYLGRWIKGTDWYPDYQLRLYDRRIGQFNGKRVHESVELSDGKPGTLQNDLQHYPYRDISDHVISIDHYTTLAAEEWSGAGRQTGVLDVVFHPPAAFLRNYVLRGGFRDGMAGFLISVLNSYYVFLKILKLWELQCGLNASTRADAGGRRRKFERAPNADQQTVNPPSDHSQSDNPQSNPQSATSQSDRQSPIGSRH
jgi:(heptosyl)LPS beta-1,4-glucosyltransferase